jgi:hypothetical protein
MTQEEAIDCHVKEDLDWQLQVPMKQEEAIDCHGRSANAACWARRKHRKSPKRAERRRKYWQGAAIQDNDPEPINFSNVAQVSLPDGARMAAARTPKISLDIAGSKRDLTAVVVDMAAFDCTLRLPWLDRANPVVNWKRRRLLLPTINVPKEVDLSNNPCRSGVPDVRSLSTAQILQIGKGGGRLYSATIRPTSGEATNHRHGVEPVLEESCRAV